MHECLKTHFKHKCIHASHHATSSCHVFMPHQHAMSSYHIIMPFSMPCHHATSACHVSMPHHHAMSSCHNTMPCHQNALFYYHVAAWGSSTWHFSQNFPCWGQTSKCNIFCIWSSFDTPFAPLESAWWALRHGTIFVAIWWFWKLAFLDPPGSTVGRTWSSDLCHWEGCTLGETNIFPYLEVCTI